LILSVPVGEFLITRELHWLVHALIGSLKQTVDSSPMKMIQPLGTSNALTTCTALMRYNTGEYI
jgi:hypothetical protein